MCTNINYCCSTQTFSKYLSLSMILLPRMNGMLDFILILPVWLRRTRSKRKLHSENFMFTVGFESSHGTVYSLRVHCHNRIARSWLLKVEKVHNHAMPVIQKKRKYLRFYDKSPYTTRTNPSSNATTQKNATKSWGDLKTNLDITKYRIKKVCIAVPAFPWYNICILQIGQCTYFI